MPSLFEGFEVFFPSRLFEGLDTSVEGFPGALPLSSSPLFFTRFLARKPPNLSTFSSAVVDRIVGFSQGRGGVRESS